MKRLAVLAFVSLLVSGLDFGATRTASAYSLQCLHKCSHDYSACIGRFYVPDLDRKKMKKLEQRCVQIDNACIASCQN
jgi:hypothetical protein